MIVKIRATSFRAAEALSAAEGLLGPWVAVRRGVRMLGAATGLALCANNSAEPPQPAPNPRFAKLERFFERYNCPLPQHVTDYLRAADRYGLDYRLLPALSIRETHCGLQEGGNNHWGYHPGRQTFPSIEAGIDYVARQLAENPVYKGKTLGKKLFTYNPRATYPGEVRRIMRQIE